ncbi:MAG: hypothetical protein IPG64_23470 [Haliea sp.]|nr:hypothetical protein [Haliea sp.]
MPLGISFFTFQAMSYIIDVYRGEAAVQKRFSSIALYIALFPQLIAGPIVRSLTWPTRSRFAGLTPHRCQWHTPLVIGLGKMLIANPRKLQDAVFSCPTTNWAWAWSGLASLCYALQI